MTGSDSEAVLAPHQRTTTATLVEQQQQQWHSSVSDTSDAASAIMELVAPNDHSPLTQLNQSMESVNNLSDEEVGATKLFLISLNLIKL